MRLPALDKYQMRLPALDKNKLQHLYLKLTEQSILHLGTEESWKVIKVVLLQ